MKPHVEYWTELGDVHITDRGKILILFHNDSSMRIEVNGADYMPEFELYTLSGVRVRTKYETQLAHKGDKVFIGVDYAPDKFAVDPNASIARTYEFSPWLDYNLKTGLYVLQIKDSKDKFYFRITR